MLTLHFHTVSHVVESYVLAQFIFDKLKLSKQVVIARSDPKQPRNNMTVTSAPMDVKIMAVTIFIAKLYYRLDDSDRYVMATGITT